MNLPHPDLNVLEWSCPCPLCWVHLLACPNRVAGCLTQHNQRAVDHSVVHNVTMCKVFDEDFHLWPPLRVLCWIIQYTLIGQVLFFFGTSKGCYIYTLTTSLEEIINLMLKFLECSTKMWSLSFWSSCIFDMVHLKGPKSCNMLIQTMLSNMPLSWSNVLTRNFGMSMLFPTCGWVGYIGSTICAERSQPFV